MKNQLIIPGKLKVGFQKRNDTYSKKLGYVVYYDEKGKLKKETSWEGWRSKNIAAEEYDNVPTEGFVLNKNVGGVSGYRSWNEHDRIEKVRVYDPRGFEFEITIPNMLYIIQECTSTKGKGLEGEFVYAWDKANLILLPANSAEFKSSQKFTALQSQKVDKDSMVPGHTYINKKQQELIYLGKLGWYEMKANRNGNETMTTSMQHVFVNPNYVDPKILEEQEKEKQDKFDAEFEKYRKAMNLKKKELGKSFDEEAFADEYSAEFGFDPYGDEYDEDDDYDDQFNFKTTRFIALPSLTNIAVKSSDIVVSNFAELMVEYSESKYANKPIGFEIKAKTPKFDFKRKSEYDNDIPGKYFVDNKNNTYSEYRISQDYDWRTNTKKWLNKYSLDKICTYKMDKNALAVISERDYSEKKYTKEQLESFGFVELFVKFDNNKKMVANKLKQYDY